MGGASAAAELSQAREARFVRQHADSAQRNARPAPRDVRSLNPTRGARDRRGRLSARPPGGGSTETTRRQVAAIALVSVRPHEYRTNDAAARAMDCGTSRMGVLRKKVQQRIDMETAAASSTTAVNAPPPAAPPPPPAGGAAQGAIDPELQRMVQHDVGEEELDAAYGSHA